MANRDVGHEFNAASDNDVIRARGDETDTGCDRLIRTNACHCYRVSWCLLAEASRQSGLATDIRCFDLLNDRTVHNVFNELFVDFRFTQKTA